MPASSSPGQRRRVLAVLLLLAGCSGSDSGPANSAPVAVVQPAAAAERGDTVLLDGTASHDEDGDSLSFGWTLVSKPAGSAAELFASDVVSPAFVADLVGTYLVSLVVHDGDRVSAPAQASVAVMVPAPKITITSPDDDAITTSSPVTVSGSVSDADGVTVNGVAATIDALAGTYTASLPLVSGSNTITAEATSTIGSSQAQIAVILNTANKPVVKIVTPKNEAVLGRAFQDNQVPDSSFVMRGTIRVYTTEAANTPGLTVNGVPATVADTSFTGCPGAPQRCFKFTVTLALSRAPHTLYAVATDVLSGKDSAKVSVISDYAFRPTNAQWEAENKTAGSVDWTSFPKRQSVKQPPHGKIQNVRSLEIDGCSAPTGENNRNDPMVGATLNEAPTAFGAGTQPPTEFLVYGQGVARALPCNVHDVCYQTAGSTRSICDKAFYEAMRAVCTKAYPPVPESQLLLYPLYRSEQKQCFNKATLYHSAVVTAGLARFNKRQEQHTYSP